MGVEVPAAYVNNCPPARGFPLLSHCLKTGLGAKVVVMELAVFFLWLYLMFTWRRAQDGVKGFLVRCGLTAAAAFTVTLFRP